MEEHVSHIRRVFQRPDDRPLKIELSKCYFAQSTIPLLGHVTTFAGVRVDDSKIAAIKSSATPSNPTELRYFLGLAGQNRLFVNGLAGTFSVLHVSTLRSAPLHWRKEIDRAFCSVKEKLPTPSFLGFSESSLPFIV